MYQRFTEAAEKLVARYGNIPAPADSELDKQLYQQAVNDLFSGLAFIYFFALRHWSNGAPIKRTSEISVGNPEVLRETYQIEKYIREVMLPYQVRSTRIQVTDTLWLHSTCDNLYALVERKAVRTDVIDEPIEGSFGGLLVAEINLR